MDVRLIIIGGDMRMNGLARAAQRSGYASEQVKTEKELLELSGSADAAVLPWPRSFLGDRVLQTDIARDTLLEHLPACEYLMGGGLDGGGFPQAKRIVDPAKDEMLLAVNAKLTAEGATAALLTGYPDALMGRTCLITGFGRIAQALTRRLAALELFVIVCARNEQQMRMAHNLGAHPVPLQQLSSAAAQADIVLNTIPARVFGSDALAQMKPGVRYIELASAPYGADPELAAKLGVSMEIMSGIPGKYAPERAGEALFDALARAMAVKEAEKGAQ